MAVTDGDFEPLAAIDSLAVGVDFLGCRGGFAALAAFIIEPATRQPNKLLLSNRCSLFLRCVFHHCTFVGVETSALGSDARARRSRDSE
jgi:hypothetical protein